MAKFKTIRDLQLAGKRVLIRVDFNVPQDKVTGAITNNQRITAALPTINYALEKGVFVVTTTRAGSGRIAARQPPASSTATATAAPNPRDRAIAGEDLSPVKARLLLMVALTKTQRGADIQRMFTQY